MAKGMGHERSLLLETFCSQEEIWPRALRAWSLDLRFLYVFLLVCVLMFFVEHNGAVAAVPEMALLGLLCLLWLVFSLAARTKRGCHLDGWWWSQNKRRIASLVIFGVPTYLSLIVAPIALRIPGVVALVFAATAAFLFKGLCYVRISALSQAEFENRCRPSAAGYSSAKGTGYGALVSDVAKGKWEVAISGLLAWMFMTAFFFALDIALLTGAAHSTDEKTRVWLEHGTAYYITPLHGDLLGVLFIGTLISLALFAFLRGCARLER